MRVVHILILCHSVVKGLIKYILNTKGDLNMLDLEFKRGAKLPTKGNSNTYVLYVKDGCDSNGEFMVERCFDVAQHITDKNYYVICLGQPSEVSDYLSFISDCRVEFVYGDTEGCDVVYTFNQIQGIEQVVSEGKYVDAFVTTPITEDAIKLDYELRRVMDRTYFEEMTRRPSNQFFKVLDNVKKSEYSVHVDSIRAKLCELKQTYLSKRYINSFGSIKQDYLLTFDDLFSETYDKCRLSATSLFKIN